MIDKSKSTVKGKDYWSELKKKYFALSAKYKVSTEYAKNRAKNLYKVSSFNDLTVKQLEYLVSKLEGGDKDASRRK